MDLSYNAIDVREHVIIPEPPRAIAIRFEIPRAYFVGRTKGMPSTIEFDDNSKLMAGEVSEIRADRCVAPKVTFLERRLSQILPKLLFGFGHVTAQSSSARHAFVDRTRRSP
jgi:hypothetical protein